MTAPAPVPAAATPISGSRQVTSLQCLTISCAVCDLAAWEEYVVHFHSERELWEWISGEGWTVRRDDTVLCPTHSADADCAENGHAWDDWYALTSDPETEYRYCEHCSAGEERRIDRQRHPLSVIRLHASTSNPSLTPDRRPP